MESIEYVLIEFCILLIIGQWIIVVVETLVYLTLETTVD